LALLLIGSIQGVSSLGAVSHHFHNDVRNTNEMQRAIGEWLGRTTPAGSWIAASDAGAVRYFSNRPTIDVLGLNTPELLWAGNAYAQTHPIKAFAVMPAWFRALGESKLDISAEFFTSNYTVTSYPYMAYQIVLTNPSPTSVVARFVQAHGRGQKLQFSLVFLPWQDP
jgi:hypothetical protein